MHWYASTFDFGYVCTFLLNVIFRLLKRRSHVSAGLRWREFRRSGSSSIVSTAPTQFPRPQSTLRTAAFETNFDARILAHTLPSIAQTVSAQSPDRTPLVRFAAHPRGCACRFPSDYEQASKANQNSTWVGGWFCRRNPIWELICLN